MRLLFFLERELHLPMLAPLMNEAHRRGLGEIGVSTVEYLESSDGMPGRGLRQRVVEEAVDAPFTIVRDPYAWRPDITFLADFSYQYVEGLGKIVNVGHGTIGKGWFFSRQPISRRENCADLLCVPGQAHVDALAQQVRIPTVVTGMPKLDAVFRGDFDREQILRENGLDPRNKTVLFAPTFNREFSIVPHIGTDLRRYIPDYLNIFIKLHGAAPEDQKRAYRAYADSHVNVAYSESMDIGPAFAASDVLLSDVSSVIFEFLSLGKPVVLFDSPTMTEYAGYDPEDLEYRYRDAGVRFSNVAQLHEMLSRTLLSNLGDEQRRTGELFVGVRNGGSSAKVIDEALKLLENDRPRAAIVLRDNGGDDLPKLVDRWRSRYQLFICTSDADRAAYATQLPQCASPFEALQTAATQTDCDKLVYYDAAWLPSPMLPDFLIEHLTFDREAGVVCPLLQVSDGGLQSLGLHVRFQTEVSPELVGWQLTYSMTGRAKSADLLDSPVFAIRRDALCDNYTNISDDRLCWLETLRCAHLNGMGQRLALDACVRPGEQPKPEAQPERPARPHLTMTSVTPQGDEGTAYDAEIEQLLSRLENDPSDMSIIKELVRCYYKAERWEQGDVYAGMIPGDPEVTLLHARSLAQQSMHEQALEEIEKIDTLAITDRDLLYDILKERGKLLLKAQRSDNARRYLEEALRLRDDDPVVFANLGTCALFANDAQLALDWFGRALQLDASQRDALFGSALARHTQGQFEAAEDLFGRLLSAAPNDMKVLKTMLQFAYESRRFTAISDKLKVYLADQPDDTDMWFVLAGVLLEQGDRPAANEAIERVIASDPQYKGAAELRERIRNI